MQTISIHIKKAISFITLFMFDIALLWCSISFVYFIRLKTTHFFNEPMLESIEFYNQLPIYYIVILIFLLNDGIYHKHFDFWEEIKRIYKGLFFGGLVVFTYLALTKQAEDFSRFVIFGTFILLLFAFPILKRMIKFILVKCKFWIKYVQIVGVKEKTSTLIEEFDKNWYLGLCVKPLAQTVIIDTRGYTSKELLRVSEEFMINTKEVLFVPTLSQVNFADADIVELHNIRLSLIEIKNRLKEPFNIMIKNSFDFFISFFILPFSFFILIFIAILIKFDSKGHIFFRQKRLGKNSKTFYCYKFRTMYENADKLMKDYLKQNPKEKEHYKIYHKYKSDPRITPLGKWLRKTSLDELPQIINVVLGDMSIVGPRPYMLSERHKLRQIKKDILLVKPGITGLWQISGRNELSFTKRVNLDRWYVRNWTLWLDLIILVKTFKVVLFKKGAS